MRIRVAAIATALVLVSCKAEGPSSADLTRIYRSPVEILSCAKASDSVYRCRFKFTNPPMPADRGEHTQCFVTDGTNWEIKILC